MNMQLWLYLLILTFLGVVGELRENVVDPKLTIVYGPGLNPALVFPARYFYIQAVDSSGKNFSYSMGDVFTVAVKGWQEPCRAWTQILDRHDGSYIVRYRLYNVCHGLTIAVHFHGQHVAQSPYQYDEHVYHEECYCPMGDLHAWQDSMGCPTIYAQIEKDLSAFPRVDMNAAVAEALRRFHQPGSYSFCNYVLLKNEQCHGQHVGFKMFVDNILLSLSRKTILPDMELLVNLGDWPLVKRKVGLAIPMFSWCGSEDTLDIVMPTYDITESTLETMGRVSLDMMSVQSNTGPIWKDKIAKGFWRGRDSRKERLELVALARKHPDLLNASLTNFFFFQDQEAEYGPKVKHVSFFDFFEYKYQVNIDGTVAAYRMPYLLGGDCTVFKQQSSYYEHFYSELEPMIHYIPFQQNLSDLVEKLKWAKANDDVVHHIAQNSRSFAEENLMPSDIFCYHAALLERFSKRIDSEIKIKEGMEHVTQPSEPKSHCTCHYPQQKLKDEL